MYGYSILHGDDVIGSGTVYNATLSEAIARVGHTLVVGLCAVLRSLNEEVGYAGSPVVAEIGVLSHDRLAVSERVGLSTTWREYETSM